jgi:hypothetical protein
MNKNNNRLRTDKREIRKLNTYLAERQSLSYSNQIYTGINKEPEQIDPRLLQRYSFDDNGGGYRGL